MAVTRKRALTGTAVGLVAAAAVTTGVVQSCDTTSTDNCGADQTAALQSRFDGAANGDEVTLHGCYRVDGTVTLRDKADVTIDGDATFKRTTESANRNASMFIVQGGRNITVSGLTVRGEKPDTQGYKPGTEGQHGLVVSASNNVTVDDVTVDQVRGDGIYLSGSNDVTIQNSRISETGRHGIGVVSGNGIHITGNRTEATHRWSIDLEPNGLAFVVNDVTITRNVFFGPTVGFLDGIGPNNNGTGCDADGSVPPPPDPGDCHFGVTRVSAPHEAIGVTAPSDPNANVLTFG